MIDEKKINKAMSSYAMETWNHEEERFAAMGGFKAGAQWMIEALCEEYSERLRRLNGRR